MPTQVIRGGAASTVVTRNTATSTVVPTRTSATSHDALNVKYIYVTERYVEYFEEDLIYGLNIFVVDNDGDTRIIIPDTISYKISIQVINNMPNNDVMVYSGYEGI